MRQFRIVKKWVRVWKLRCKKCGKKVTYYDDDLPTEGWNGWDLKDTEICPICKWAKIIPSKTKVEV
jgi:hypothetical protein